MVEPAPQVVVVTLVVTPEPEAQAVPVRRSLSVRQQARLLLTAVRASMLLAVAVELAESVEPAARTMVVWEELVRPVASPEQLRSQVPAVALVH